MRLKEKWRRKKLAKFHRHDERLVQSLSARKRAPSMRQLAYISEYLSKCERLSIRIMTGVIIIALASLVLNVYWTRSAPSPRQGGSYTEGLVGAPRHLNPLFAPANDVDLDIDALVYSGLLKFKNGGLTNDLAENYQISDDRKTYSFNLRQGVKWHDGESFGADDVVFTVNRIKEQKTGTPLYYNFQGAEIEKINDFGVKFVLSEPFAPFLESLTVGILPEHIWKDIQPANMMLAEYNTKPIGTGPYQFKSLVKDKNGEIKSYNLTRNKGYYRSPIYVDDISFKFYDSFDSTVEALNNKNIEGMSYLPKELRDRVINNRNLKFNLLHLPQYTAVFFNYDNNPVLKDAKMRQILSHGVNKEKIVNEILNAEAQAIESAILPDSLGYTGDIAAFKFDVQKARALLDQAGWKLADYENEGKDAGNPTAAENYPFQVRKYQNRYLEFSLATVNQPENVRIAKELQKEWQLLNAKVNLVIVNQDKIAETIKSRGYDALLYGQIMGQDPDPYPFWHSSQRVYPGLNLTSLNNSDIDKLLEDARKISDDAKRADKYRQFEKKLADLAPAVFLFNPTYTYPQNKKIKSFGAANILAPADRFSQANEWYIKTERVWQK